MKHWLSLGVWLMIGPGVATAGPGDSPWPMHIIDQASRGADGVRLGDVDQDGRLDIATGWEEGGQIRICFQPPPAEVRRPWPAAAVGHVRSPEDAVFADVNQDGWLDVVSCCEGSQQAVFCHLNPGPPNIRLSQAWQTVLLPGSSGVTRWMFCEPLDAEPGTDQPLRLILGSKNPNGRIVSWTLAGSDLQGTYQTLRPAAWIMSLRRIDIDRDGDNDILFSDRKGQLREIGWLEQRNSDSSTLSWQQHSIGGQGLEVMFLDLSPATATRPVTLVGNTRNGHLQLLTPATDVRQPWQLRQVAHPPQAGGGKGVAIGDIDGDGRLDLVGSCESAEAKVGVYWLSEPAQPESDPQGFEQWVFHDISGADRGIKFDRIELLDLDGDTDLDVLTCEERDGLGVIWYENPGI